MSREAPVNCSREYHWQYGSSTDAKGGPRGGETAVSVYLWMLIYIGDVSTVAGFPVRKRICSAVLHVMLLLVCVALDHELRLMNALVRSRSGQRVGDQTIVTSPRRRSGTRDPSAAFSITQTARVMQFDRQKPCFFQRMKYHVRYGELLPAGLQNGDVLAVHLLVCESQCGVMPAPCVEPAPHKHTSLPQVTRSANFWY